MDLQQCFCIKSDVISSRSTGKVDLLPGMAEKLNDQYRQELITPFTIRAGDELFAVVNSIQRGYQVFKTLFSMAGKDNIPLYVGLGIGSIEPQYLEDSERINGTAIWRASSALDELKKKPDFEALKHVSKSRFRYNLHVSQDESVNQAVETYLYFIMSRINKRTPRQKQAVEARENHPDWSNDQLFRYVSKTENKYISTEYAIANFSKLLMRADYQLVREAENAFIHLLSTINEKAQS